MQHAEKFAIKMSVQQTLIRFRWLGLTFSIQLSNKQKEDTMCPLLWTLSACICDFVS